jgi:hypothetical protein
MVTRRTILIFNFGVAALFLIVGGLSIYVQGVLQPDPSHLRVPPAFDVPAMQSILDEKDEEQLRSKALFYYQLARDFRKARYEANEGYLSELRWLSFFVAGLFAIGGGLVLAPRKSGKFQQ